MYFGSICSGIDAASVAFKDLNLEPLWFSEIADFPNRVLKYHYPNIKNLGDMHTISESLRKGIIKVPDVLLGGTPCQSFSLAGWKKGLLDKRGSLTLSFIDIANAIDEIRINQGKQRSIVLWENVEGVLRDKTNAFGIFISGLAGLEEEIKLKKWSAAGILFGKTRNVVWRILDAKFFGLPQQRRRLFVIATDKNEIPNQILFELTKHNNNLFNYKNLYSNKVISKGNLSLFNNESKLEREINFIKCEVFREYTDCLYSAYGTKWNGNAAAYNGSLYISQNHNIRRLTPLECERLMGFPDNYTQIPNNRDTNRYQAIGNSWAIPVIKWLGSNILNLNTTFNKDIFKNLEFDKIIDKKFKLYLLNDDFTHIDKDTFLNTSPCPNNFKKGNIFSIIDTEAKDKFYISTKGSNGILRRKNEKLLKMNNRLEELFVLNSRKSILL
ncbi:MAG: DNA (cytosine-5-)-methyltransferase [Thiomargarita sp.]|nr:DNA (cytosine-5-)-methyltransferase [Bacteroidales bacterium]MCK5718374.1 DNA (cytosine-5-)-methyltransferase [Thiomargarita sp.]